MDLGIVSLINKFYRYVKISLIFWLYSLKGVIVYGLVPSMFSMFSVIKEVSITNEDDILVMYKKYYSEYSRLKLHSFCTVFSLIILYCGLYFLNLHENTYLNILRIVLIYTISLIILILSYSVYISVFEGYSIKESLVRAFIISVKYFGVSIIYLIFLYVYLQLAQRNLVLMLCVHPFILVLAIKYIFECILPKMGYECIKTKLG